MEALLYEKKDDAKVQCRLCSHRCVISSGSRGICGVRENIGGRLDTLVYDKVIALHVDPIEKKPLFHFLPGTLCFSLGTVGCNFKCRFCQNADIAQMPSDHNGRIIGDVVSPEEIVSGAVKSGCRSIAYTYTEPTVFFELAYETARLAQKRDLKNIFVTNGYMTAEALEMIGPFLDAANVDLKAFSDDFYKKQCGARLAPVLDTLRLMKKTGVFVEITTLLIPGLNDDPSELAELAGFIRDDIGDDTPWHVSRFHPTYRLLDRPPTPQATLAGARDIGLRAGLKYVYTGNIPGDNGENTFCPGCGRILIGRRGFAIIKKTIRDDRCPDCGAVISGVGLST
jgi:pyruvate formate lyase activating enzyme